MSAEGLLWFVRRYAPAVVLPVTLVLLLAVAGLWLAVLRPLQLEVEAAERQQRVQREGLLRRADINREGNPQERLARFYAFFEGAESLPVRLFRLHAIARASGLELRRAEYRMHAQPGERLARYQIIMPVEGSYRSIRRFTAQALEEIPALALTQVKFQRRRISEGSAEAQIIFTLYLKS
jgi:hypothetical protein